MNSSFQFHWLEWMNSSGTYFQINEAVKLLLIYEFMTANGTLYDLLCHSWNSTDTFLIDFANIWSILGTIWKHFWLIVTFLKDQVIFNIIPTKTYVLIFAICRLSYFLHKIQNKLSQISFQKTPIELSTLVCEFESSCGILFRGVVFGSKKEILEPNSQESNIM